MEKSTVDPCMHQGYSYKSVLHYWTIQAEK